MKNVLPLMTGQPEDTRVIWENQFGLIAARPNQAELVRTCTAPFHTLVTTGSACSVHQQRPRHKIIARCCYLQVTSRFDRGPHPHQYPHPHPHTRYKETDTVTDTDTDRHNGGTSAYQTRPPSVAQIDRDKKKVQTTEARTQVSLLSTRYSASLLSRRACPAS